MVRKQIKLPMFGRTLELGSPMAITFWIFVIIFVVGTYYMYGPGGGGGGPRGGGGGERSLSAVVASVDGKSISRNDYEGRLYYTERIEQPPLTQMRQVKTQILDGLISQQLMLEAARAEGITVSNAEIEAERDRMVDEILATRYADRRSLRRVLESKNMSLEAFRDELRRERTPEDEVLRTNLLFDKLEQQVRDAVTLNDEQLRQSYEEVKAQHLLIDPERLMAEANAEDTAEESAGDAATDEEAPTNTVEGEEPAQPADEAAADEPQMTIEQAQAEARETLTELKKRVAEGEDFGTVADDYVEELGLAARHEDLGWFTRGRMVAEFEQAAFALQPGQMSDIIQTNYGLHVLEVEDLRLELPEDFEENKEQYREEKLEERREQAWGRYMQALHDGAQIEIVDPELRAYKLLQEDPMVNAAQAAELLNAAIEGDPYNASARFQLASLLAQGGQTEQAISVMTDLVESEVGARSPEAHMQLGMMLKEAGRDEEALERFQSASEWAQGFDWQNMFLHMQVQQMFTEMGKDELAEKEQQWLDEYQAAQAQQMPPMPEIEMEEPPADEGGE